MGLTINIDGASRGNPGPAASAAIFRRDGTVVKRAARVIGNETNNVAEYRALLGALRYLPAIRKSGEPVEILSDSKLVVEQVNGRWECGAEHLVSLCNEAMSLLTEAGGGVTLRWIPREQNRDTDALCNRALDDAMRKAG